MVNKRRALAKKKDTKLIFNYAIKKLEKEGRNVADFSLKRCQVFKYSEAVFVAILIHKNKSRILIKINKDEEIKESIQYNSMW